MNIIDFKDKRAVNEKHKLYDTWKWLIKAHTAKGMVCERWLDFWNFVEDVGEKPEIEGEKVHFHRHYFDKPYAPGNYRWKHFKKNDETRKKKAEYAKKYRVKKAAEMPDYFKNMDLKKCYGITIKQYNEMLAKQKGVCAICEGCEKSTAPSGKTRPLALDHCHSTGMVRGLLCSRCNRALGFFGDSIPSLKKAISYLGGNIE